MMRIALSEKAIIMLLEYWCSKPGRGGVGSVTSAFRLCAVTPLKPPSFRSDHSPKEAANRDDSGVEREVIQVVNGQVSYLA